MGFKLKQALLVLTTAFLLILELFSFAEVSARKKVFIKIFVHRKASHCTFDIYTMHFHLVFPIILFVFCHRQKMTLLNP